MTDTAVATETIVVEREMAHPPEKIWRALTDSALMDQWLMKNDFTPVVGHRFTFRMPGGPGWNGITDSEVLIVEPNKRLSYTWNSSGEEAANGLKTVVTFTLTPAAGGTHLRMEQSGFKPDQKANSKGAQYGWQKFLGALDGVVAKLA
jgi:uncharacterized protein YndB with AHSA1/START domain